MLVVDKMTREQAEQYRAGWARVKEFHVRELRRMPLRTKIKKAELLFQLAQSLKLRHSVDDPELVALRTRWARLKRRYENTT